MLKTSPVITSSANASPAFHHARHSTRSPHLSPSGGSSRPISSPGRTLMRSPGQLRSKRSALNDETSTSGTASPVPATQSRTQTPDEPPPPPQPQVMTLSTAPGDPVPVPHTVEPPQTTADETSPSKRRNSLSAFAQREQSSATVPSDAQGEPLTTKRSKTEEENTKILPARYELCSVDDLVELIAHMICELITTNDAIRTASGGLTRFHSRTAPGISVRDYLHRIARHATLTPPLLLAVVYYIDRLCSYYPDFTINTLTVHRFLITAATVAAKGLSDAFWNNTTYARVGGIRVAELKMLELEFLYRVDWRIVPDPEVLVAYYHGLVERTPGFELQESSSEDELDDDDDDDDDSGSDV